MFSALIWRVDPLEFLWILYPIPGSSKDLPWPCGPHDREISLQGAAAGMLDQGRLPKVQDLFSVRFSLGHGRRSYRAAGAFLQFIAREQGWKTVVAAYRKGGLNAAVSTSKS